MYSCESANLSPGQPAQLKLGCTPVLAIAATIAAGFPSPAEDHAAKPVDLNEVLIKHPLSTYLMRVRGASMREAGIDDGDVVLVDRAIKPVHGHIVVAVVDNDFTVKRLWRRGSNIKLQAANPTYPDIVPREGQTVEIWGVVTNAIKQMRV
ncbi:translesion error-prone DNA polymerase V autoproteolytic subunit [Ideonella sp. B7]|uniref:LexA family protein n=1 Tax=Ideonella benzenivorans TaxID=2831643 RepID=UPI0035BFF700|nr:translesion error-prone DNA polymerase V autoproteolytic subunit [Ideonella benzenivorans]